MTIIKEPLVSVIVPVYNVEQYIDDCLNSIKQQSYKNLEIIMVEDCSTDNSLQMLQSHLDDKRIKLIQHKENRGLSAARNTGIKAATGEYLMFVDSDDIIDSNLISVCLDCALQKNADVITYGFVPFKDGLTQPELAYPTNNLNIKSVMLDNSYFNLPHFAWLKFIRSSSVRSASLEFPVGLYYEDWPFHWHLGLATATRYQLQADLYLYRQRGSSITGSKGKELLDLFIIHSKVHSLLQDHGDDDIKKIFASKVKQSHWSILTRIDSEYLATALKEAKKARVIFKLKSYKNNMAVRSMIISEILSMPNYTALRSLKLLRMTLHSRIKVRANKINTKK
ncbi:MULTISPECIES: glycosyltransferase family 2 protein [Psychrobacter]|uniref:glycosyltransferase family 2 protein n=1 Tax=Psychrobacter TaxID=497 RepID=UPI00146D9EBD|nr:MULTISPECIES: glycosyltransferase family 2 protein [Psychrobacter]